MYSGVPQIVKDLFLITLANPKSVNLMYPILEIRIFSGFKSRYAI